MCNTFLLIGLSTVRYGVSIVLSFMFLQFLAFMNRKKNDDAASGTNEDCRR